MSGKSLLSALVVCGLGIATTSYLYNFHCVIPHQVYRSAQLSAFSLNVLSHFTKLKTIVNLRGEHPTAHWYQAEQAYASQHHIRLINVPLNATHLPNQQEMQTLTEALLNAPKPLLLHCQGGADRSGLVSAMALLLSQSELAPARKQFSWRYYAFKKDRVGEQVMHRYEQWLALHGFSHSRAHFIEWTQATGPYTLPTVR